MAPIIELEKPRLIESTNATLDASSIAVVTVTTAGSADVKFFVMGPSFLRGEDYPSLVRVWDNGDDAIFDRL